MVFEDKGKTYGVWYWRPRLNWNEISRDMMVFTNCENISTACKNKQNVLAMAVKLVSNSTTQHSCKRALTKRLTD